MDTAEILKKVRQIEIQTDRLVSETFAGYGLLGKLTGSMLMLFGRLELLPMFILLTRSAWKKY